MTPNSLSASAVDAFNSCPSRWVAESHKRMGSSSPAAQLGTAVHSTLEEWVEDDHYVDPSVLSNFHIMEKMFEVHYTGLFAHDRSFFDDGVEMLKDWHERNHPWDENREVISTEKKESFDLQTSIGPVPFNYIWDRCDKLPGDEIDVVDYKTIRFPLNHDAMKESIQVRSYALAAAIKFAHLKPKRIWVTLDMLRHGDPISVCFSRYENMQTWTFLHDIAEKVIEMDVNDPPERVNSKCRFCIRKTVCKTLTNYAATGSVATYSTVDELIDQRAKLDNAMQGIKWAIEELDKDILQLAEEEDTLDFESGSTRALIRSRRRRVVDPDMVKRVVPDEVWEDYGGVTIKMGDLDKLMDDPRIDSETRSKVVDLIKVSLTKPFIITEPILDMED